MSYDSPITALRCISVVSSLYLEALKELSSAFEMNQSDLSKKAKNYERDCSSVFLVHLRKSVSALNEICRSLSSHEFHINDLGNSTTASSKSSDKWLKLAETHLNYVSKKSIVSLYPNQGMRENQAIQGMYTKRLSKELASIFEIIRRDLSLSIANKIPVSSKKENVVEDLDSIMEESFTKLGICSFQIFHFFTFVDDFSSTLLKDQMTEQTMRNINKFSSEIESNLTKFEKFYPNFKEQLENGCSNTPPMPNIHRALQNNSPEFGNFDYSLMKDTSSSREHKRTESRLVLCSPRQPMPKDSVSNSCWTLSNQEEEVVSSDEACNVATKLTSCLKKFLAATISIVSLTGELYNEYNVYLQQIVEIRTNLMLEFKIFEDSEDVHGFIADIGHFMDHYMDNDSRGFQSNFSMIMEYAHGIAKKALEISESYSKLKVLKVSVLANASDLRHSIETRKNDARSEKEKKNYQKACKFLDILEGPMSSSYKLCITSIGESATCFLKFSKLLESMQKSGNSNFKFLVQSHYSLMKEPARNVIYVCTKISGKFPGLVDKFKRLKESNKVEAAHVEDLIASAKARNKSQDYSNHKRERANERSFIATSLESVSFGLARTASNAASAVSSIYSYFKPSANDNENEAVMPTGK